MLNCYPTTENCDEVHFGYGPETALRILRCPWEKDCLDCTMEHRNQSEKDQKKIHAWGAIRYGFKSELMFYNIASNTNGKLTQAAYINQILEPVVLPWILRGDKFVLEEDGDSGHGPNGNNPVR